MFNVDWEFLYLFTENIFNEAQCMVCYRAIATMKKYNLERHYNSCHNEYEKYSGDERKQLATELKKTFDQKFNGICFDKKAESSNMSKETLKASYIVSLALAKHCRPFEDGIFFKDLSKLVLECFGEKGKECINIINSIPLSRETIVRRTEQINLYINSQIKKRILDSTYYSICLDESTDINDVSQLIIGVRTVDSNFSTCEEILSVVSMHGNVTGQIIYEAVEKQLFSFADKKKLSSVCTDGAAVMSGKKKGFTGFLIKNNIIIPAFHCIIHQQILFSKAINIAETMKIAIKIVNKIRGGHNALNHRKFGNFLKEMQADYGDLLLHTEVRWLSRGKCLQRLFDLRLEVQMFLESDCSPEAQELVLHLKNPTFLLDLAFLCDITQYLNEFNLILQGKDKNIIQLVSTVDALIRKMELLQRQFQEQNLTFLPRTDEIYKTYLNNERLSTYLEIFRHINNNFNNRFNDFSQIRNLIELYERPLICDISQQTIALQNELRKMQQDLSLPLETGIEFWKSVDNNVYPNIKEAIYKLWSMFGSTYLCESAFSILKLIKSKQRNRLSDIHVEALMQIKHYTSPINIEELMQTSSNQSL